MISLKYFTMWWGPIMLPKTCKNGSPFLPTILPNRHGFCHTVLVTANSTCDSYVDGHYTSYSFPAETFMDFT